MKPLRNKQIPLVKVLWKHHGMEEATWEPKSTMRAQYPQLFSSSNNFEDETGVEKKSQVFDSLNFLI